MATYKKRGQAGWTGKKEAKTLIGRERNFEKQEIRQTMQEIEQGDDFRYTYHAKRIKNEHMRLKNQIGWYERVLERYKRWDLSDGWLLSGLERAKAKYAEKFGE